MTGPPTLQPEEFHDLLVDAVAGFDPAQPLMAPLQRRARRRRHRVIGGCAAAATLVVAAAIAVPLALTGHQTADQIKLVGPGQVKPTPTVRHHGPVLAPTPHSSEPFPAAKALRACKLYAATHTFLEADSAVVDSSGAVTITGHQGSEQCGGPDDVQYNWTKAVRTFVIAPSAIVRTIHYGSSGPVDGPIVPTTLPQHLQNDTKGRFFRYAGPDTGVLSLVELYHP